MNRSISSIVCETVKFYLNKPNIDCERFTCIKSKYTIPLNRFGKYLLANVGSNSLAFVRYPIALTYNVNRVAKQKSRIE